MTIATSQTTLGECVTFLSGGTPSKSNPAYWGGDIPWVSCKDMKVDRLHDTEDHITRLGAQNGTRLVDRGTILIVVRGMILAKVFPIAIAQRQVAFNQDLKAVICREGVVSEYLYYWLKANEHEIVGLADEAAHGTKRLQTDRLVALDVELPQEEYQRRIVAILSAYDDLIENNTRRIHILEDIARRIYEEWFVRFRFPGHENVRMVEREFGLIPEGWNIKSLKDVCCLVQYGYTASAKHEATNSRFLRITDIVPPFIDWDTVPYCDVSEKVFEKYKLVVGDIVIARTGATTGYAKRLNKFHPASIFASYLIRLRANADTSNYFLGIAVESEDYKRFIKANLGGAAQPQANAQVLASKILVVPTTELQREFDKIVEGLMDQKEILQRKNLNLRRTRDLLLPKLISGEIDVSNLPEPVTD